MSTDVSEFITDLEAGTFEPRLAAAISQVALAVMDHKQKGKIVITLDLVPMSATQLNITHKLSYKRPTMRGDMSENVAGKSAMYVSEKGRVSQFPEHQMDGFGNSAKQKQGA